MTLSEYYDILQSMIEINDMRIGAKYWFDFGNYSAFGRFAERDCDIIVVQEALVYIKANKNRFFFEERLLIDAYRIRNISINSDEADEDNSDYYANYDYRGRKTKNRGNNTHSPSK